MINGSANARTTRIIVLAVLAATVAAGTEACTLPSSSVTTCADKTHGTTAKHSTAPANKAAEKAKVGDSITLESEIDDEKVTVKLTKIVTGGVHATDGFSTPDNGKRYVVVQFRLTNSGTNAFSDDPYLDVQILDDAGQSFQPDIMMTDSTAGHGFASTVNIAPGDSQLGFIIVQMPTKDDPADIQFSLDGGLGATAQWQAS